MTGLEFLIPLITNKYVLGLFGVLGAGFLVYFKGIKDASNKFEKEQLEAEKNQAKEINKVTKKNQDLDTKREVQNEKVRATTVISKLIELFNSQNKGS